MTLKYPDKIEDKFAYQENKVAHHVVTTRSLRTHQPESE